MAILPRMVSDRRHHRTNLDTEGSCVSCNASTFFSMVGGRLSHPYRKALLLLVTIEVIRLVCFHHIVFPYLDVDKHYVLGFVDAVIGIVHVVGQSFLCLTTAYLLQCQLVQVINIGTSRPGENLVPYLQLIALLSLVGGLGSLCFQRSRLWALVNVAEALSCYPVLHTLRLYISVTVTATEKDSQQRHKQQPNPLLRGPVLTQILAVCEIWYMMMSLLSCLAELVEYNMETATITSTTTTVDTWIVGRPLQLLLLAAGHNQGNGVNDWTRLLLHSIFLNTLDELNHHISPSQEQSSSSSQRSSASANTPTPTTHTTTATASTNLYHEQRSSSKHIQIIDKDYDDDVDVENTTTQGQELLPIRRHV